MANYNLSPLKKRAKHSRHRVSELKKKIKTAKDNLTEFSNNILGESSFNLNDPEKVDNATVRPNILMRCALKLRTKYEHQINEQ